jgi:hypothetical protein
MTLTRLLSFMTLVLLMSACSSSKKNTNNSGFEHGFMPVERGDLALIGPVQQDRHAFERIRDLEATRTLATIDGARDLRDVLRGSSQTMLAASAPAIFRAGVYNGAPELIELACDSLKRVTHSGLRRTNELAQFDNACSALHGGGFGGRGSCAESTQTLVRAYSELKSGDERSARRSTADALRDRSTCTEGRALVRTPVTPDSRGFIIVVALQASMAAPATYLASESAPQTADAVNAAFAQNARLIKHGDN